MTLRCIIVEDEVLQQEVLKDYLNEVPELELAATFQDGRGVVQFLRQEKVDLIFIDINMPGINGVDLIKQLINPPAVIFTTAYPEYAVEGFNLNAVDYLLKPISFDRFMKAIEKYIGTKGKSKGESNDTLLIKSGKKEYRLKMDTIQYIESMGDYVRIVAGELSVIAHGTMSQYLGILSEKKFCRIHKSFIINMELIDYFEGNMVSLKGKKFSLGKAYRDGFIDSWRGGKEKI